MRQQAQPVSDVSQSSALKSVIVSIKSEGLYKRFVEMEKDAGSIIANFRSRPEVNLWPVLRRAFFSDFYNWDIDRYINGNMSSHHGLVRIKRTIHKEFLDALAAAPKGLPLVLSHKSIHVRMIDGKRYDPYLDPVVQEMTSIGLKPMKLQIYEGELGEYFIDPAEIPVEHAQSPLPLDMVPGIAGYKDYVKLAVEHGVPPLHHVRILQEYEEVRAWAELFGRILVVLRPKFVILQEYYNPLAMGMSLACRERGVPCVEYQHGMQCRHIMYTFQHVPKAGFEVVPKWFFTWGDAPARELRAMFADQIFHKVAVAGKAEYLAWAKGFVREEEETETALRELVRGRKAILVPLRLNLQEHEVAALRQAIETSPPDWLWLLRGHPLFHSDELEGIKAAAHVETQLATRLMLDTVLSLSDHVVCGCSTVCQEARFLHGLPVTLVGELPAYFFSDHIAANAMQTAASSEEILQSIQHGRRQQADVPIPDAPISRDTTLLAPLLQQLAGKAW